MRGVGQAGHRVPVLAGELVSGHDEHLQDGITVGLAKVLGQCRDRVRRADLRQAFDGPPAYGLAGVVAGDRERFRRVDKAELSQADRRMAAVNFAVARKEPAQPRQVAAPLDDPLHPGDHLARPAVEQIGTPAGSAEFRR